MKTNEPNLVAEAGGASPGRPQADAGGAAALRLEKRTHFDPTQGRMRVSLIDYGKGLGEVGWSFVSAKKPIKAGRGESRNIEQNRSRSIRRSRSRLRQLILSANLDHLLTLTYRENQTDIEQASADFSRFIRKVRAELPSWAYVAVPEQQKRGAWHWHIAVQGRQDVNLLRTLWREIVGEGNIDVQAPKARNGSVRLAIVRYLGKYLAKGFDQANRALNGRRYRASHGIQVPMISLPVPKELRKEVARIALEELLRSTGSIGHIWQDEQLSAGWACSWS